MPLPTLFVSHGPPTLIIEDVPSARFLRALGGTFARPEAVLCVSAHWETAEPSVSAVAAPETIYDFYGFPDALYRLRYAAPGAPELARRTAALLDGVLSGDFRDPLPDVDGLAAELDADIDQARDFEDVLDISRRWTHDREFQIGVQMLRGDGQADRLGATLADLADAVLRSLKPRVEDAFDALPKPTNGPREPARYVGGANRQPRDLEQAHVLLGMKGIAFEDKDFHAASMFSTLLGGGMSSRLFQEVREKRGLAYSIYSYLSSYTDGGLFGVYAGTGKDDVRDLVPLVFGEISKLADGARGVGGGAGGADDAEIARARAQIKAGILMSLESTAARCEQLARQMIVFKRPIPVDETIARIDAVDGAAIRRVAERLLSGRPTITALGPVPDLEDLEKLAAAPS